MLGVITALIGLGLLSLVRTSNLNIGDGLVFLCAISYALQITLVGRYAPSYPVLPLAFVQIFSCGVFSLIGSLIFEEHKIWLSSQIWFNGWVLSALLICSILATAVAFVAQNYFQVYTTPTRTALIFSTEPVFAALTGYIWAGDRLTVLQILGCFLILVGMLVSEIGSLKVGQTK